MRAYEIIGGWAHICDCCQKDDGRPTYYWVDANFDLCFECMAMLADDPPGASLCVEPRVIIIRKRISEELRNKIFERDGYRCLNCENKKELQIDHIVPFSKGGITTYNNLQTLCKKCNLGKRNQYGK